MARRTTEKPTTTKKTRAASTSRKAGGAARAGSGVVKKVKRAAAKKAGASSQPQGLPPLPPARGPTRSSTRSAGVTRSALGDKPPGEAGDGRRTSPSKGKAAAGGDKESVTAAALLGLHAPGVQEGPAVQDHDAGLSGDEGSLPASPAASGRVLRGSSLPQGGYRALNGSPARGDSGVATKKGNGSSSTTTAAVVAAVAAAAAGTMDARGGAACPLVKQRIAKLQDVLDESDGGSSAAPLRVEEEDSTDAALQGRGGKGKQPARAPRMEDETAGQDEEEEEDEEEAEEDDDAGGREEGDSEEEEGEVQQNKESWKYETVEKEVILQVVLERLGDRIYAKEFSCGKGYQFEQWYSRVAHFVKIELAKNKAYMQTHGSLQKERFGRAEMKHLRDWFVAQKQNYLTAMKKPGTGSEGGRIERSPNKFQPLRNHIFSGNAAANKRRFMREVVTWKRPKVAPADAGGAAGASGGGASSGQGEGKGKGKRRKMASLNGGGGGTSGESQAPGGDDAAGEGSGGKKQKSRRKAAPVAVEEDDVDDLQMDVGGGDWTPSEPEDEEELLSRGGAGGEGGMSDRDLKDAADDSSPDVVEVKRNRRRRNSEKFDPKRFQRESRKERNARDKSFTASMLQGIRMILGERGQKDGSGAADSAGGASGVDRGKMEAAEKSVPLLRSSWMDSILAAEKGYGSQDAVKEKYERYQAAVARQEALISGVDDG